MSLELQDLSVDISGQRIVTGIGFTVPDGGFAGLLGPNGNGKSTILKAIYRVHRPSAGRVLLDGADVLSMRPRDAARRIAVVAQEFTLEFDFTVAEMVMIGRTRTSGPSTATTTPTAPSRPRPSHRPAARNWRTAALTRCPAARSSGC